MTDETNLAEKTPEAPKPPVDQGAKFPVDLFIKDASHNVSVQGMLADKPELRTANLSDSEWDTALAEYNKKRIA